MWENIKHFKQHEFDSPDKKGSGANMQESFVRKLDDARTLADTPFSITSGYRTPAHNKKVGGVANSSHVTGYAADIAVKSNSARFKILNALHAVGFNRIGIGKGFIHVDNDPTKPQNTVWVYATLKDIEG